jgi:hypothetical protein
MHQLEAIGEAPEILRHLCRQEQNFLNGVLILELTVDI